MRGLTCSLATLVNMLGWLASMLDSLDCRPHHSPATYIRMPQDFKSRRRSSMCICVCKRQLLLHVCTYL